MATQLTVRPNEQGTLILTASFKNEAGNLITPNANTLKWTLLRLDGSIVNLRQDVAITSGASVSIVLSDADLALVDGKDTGHRVLLLKGTYDSGAYTSLPLRDEVGFTINNLLGV